VRGKPSPADEPGVSPDPFCGRAAPQRPGEREWPRLWTCWLSARAASALGRVGDGPFSQSKAVSRTLFTKTNARLMKCKPGGDITPSHSAAPAAAAPTLPRGGSPASVRAEVCKVGARRVVRAEGERFHRSWGVFQSRGSPRCGRRRNVPFPLVFQTLCPPALTILSMAVMGTSLIRLRSTGHRLWSFRGSEAKFRRFLRAD